MNKHESNEQVQGEDPLIEKEVIPNRSPDTNCRKVVRETSSFCFIDLTSGRKDQGEKISRK